MTTSEKLNKILFHLNINAKVLSENLGYKRPQIMYDIQTGKTKKLSSEFINKLTSVYPVFNKVWLLTGEGEMLNDNSVPVIGEIPSKPSAESSDLSRALDEISEMRKLVQEQVRYNQEQFDRLMRVIESMQKINHNKD